MELFAHRVVSYVLCNRTCCIYPVYLQL